MREHIEERCVRIGQYIIETGATVRAAAARFGVSKSSVHKDVGERLPLVHSALAAEVRKVLKYHQSVRHIRGGEATRAKYRGQTDSAKRRNCAHGGEYCNVHEETAARARKRRRTAARKKG